MKPALCVLMIVSLAGPSELGPYAPPSNGPNAPASNGPYAPSNKIFTKDAIRRAVSIVRRDPVRRADLERAVARDDPRAAQKPLTRKERAAIGAVIGSILGAIGASTVGQEMCLDHPRWTCAVLGGAEGGAIGAMIGWKHK